MIHTLQVIIISSNRIRKKYVKKNILIKLKTTLLRNSAIFMGLNLTKLLAVFLIIKH
jgi:hypothetical protein